MNSAIHHLRWDMLISTGKLRVNEQWQRGCLTKSQASFLHFASCFCAVENRNIVGVIMAGHDGRRGFIHHTTVAETYRKQGIGRELVNHVLMALEEEGINKAALLVFRRNELGNIFWENVGFSGRKDIVYRSNPVIITTSFFIFLFCVERLWYNVGRHYTAGWHRSPTRQHVRSTWYNVRVGNEQCQDVKMQISVLARKYLHLCGVIGRQAQASAKLPHERAYGSRMEHCGVNVMMEGSAKTERRRVSYEQNRNFYGGRMRGDRGTYRGGRGAPRENGNCDDFH